MLACSAGFSSPDDHMKNFDNKRCKVLLYISPGYMDFTTDFSEEKVQEDSLRAQSF